MEKGLIEYAQEVDILGKTDGGFRVRFTRNKETVEKEVGYEPLPLDGWKYADGTLVKDKDTYFSLIKYTTYSRDGKLVFAYKKCGVKRFDDGMVYENEIGDRYILVEDSPFLSVEKVQELIDKLDTETQPYRASVREKENEIEGLKKTIKDIEKTYDISSKCQHKWELDFEEEINDGRTTHKSYLCETCGAEDNHYWHKL